MTGIDDNFVADAAHAAARLSKLVEKALEEVRLSLPQFRLMLLLADGSAVATALSQRLTVSRPSITALVDGLVQRGFVERLPDPDDRRRVSHDLTAAGVEALRAGEEAIESRLLATVSHLSAGDRKAAVKGLAIWLRGLDLAREAKQVERLAAQQ